MSPFKKRFYFAKINLLAAPAEPIIDKIAPMIDPVPNSYPNSKKEVLATKPSLPIIEDVTDLIKVICGKKKKVIPANRKQRNPIKAPNLPLNRAMKRAPTKGKARHNAAKIEKGIVVSCEKRFPIFPDRPSIVPPNASLKPVTEEGSPLSGV